jgi:hypothetical protein
VLTKKAKPSPEASTLSKADLQEPLKTDVKEPPKAVRQISDTEEEETDAITRARLLKIATEPTPIAKPQPIEIRVITPKK